MLVLLLIDDDLFFPARLATRLAPHGVTLRVADEGELAPVLEDPPHCVVVNFGAAPERRARFVRQLKQDPRTCQIPVLAFAGHLETELHRLAREAGADKVVANSALSERPLALIEAVIERVRSGAAPDPEELVEE